MLVLGDVFVAGIPETLVLEVLAFSLDLIDFLFELCGLKFQLLVGRGELLVLLLQGAEELFLVQGVLVLERDKFG